MSNKVEIKISVDGSEATVSADFSLLAKGYAMLTQMEMQGKTAKLVMDVIGCGDKILFFGDFEGDETIKTDPRKRAKACKIIAREVQNIFGDEDEAEKKS